MLFGDVLDAVARVAGISVRSRDEMTNFIRTRGRQSKHCVYRKPRPRCRGERIT
jgi:hypothetical protein